MFNGVYFIKALADCYGDQQRCRFSRIIAYVTLIFFYFYYQKIYFFRIKVSKKINYLILRKSSLVTSVRPCVQWIYGRIAVETKVPDTIKHPLSIFPHAFLPYRYGSLWTRAVIVVNEVEIKHRLFLSRPWPASHQQRKKNTFRQLVCNESETSSARGQCLTLSCRLGIGARAGAFCNARSWCMCFCEKGHSQCFLVSRIIG